ncbi:MAG: class I SAM-dependent methyltransferase [Candidatus Obscuribacterales bacterium]|nr:class I SAM-dependent methyltransferase [Candidatus Obscuribacterales bacterium]
MTTNAATASWFSDFFNGAALDLWRKAIPLDQTEEEVQFLCDALGLDEESRLLDVPCGNGRLSIPLGVSVQHVTGVDFSDEFIAEARSAAKTHEARCEFVKVDMRKLEWKEEFDGAFCMGNSFGYFDKKGTLDFMKSVSRALKPGARFVIDSNMIAESFLVNGSAKEWIKVDDIYMLVENRYNCQESLVETTYRFLANGKEETREAIHWIYTAGELCNMIKQSGFNIVDLLESTEGDSYALGSERLLAIVEKL